MRSLEACYDSNIESCPMFSIHGIGTAVYGERDYRPDGSYVTTEWVIFAWMPIFPISSLRISCFQTRFYAVYDASSYYVHETSSAGHKQVLSVVLLVCEPDCSLLRCKDVSRGSRLNSLYPGAWDFSRSSICATPSGKATERKRVGECEG